MVSGDLRKDEEFEKYAKCLRRLKDAKPTCKSGYRCVSLNISGVMCFADSHNFQGLKDYPNTFDSFLAFHMLPASSLSFVERCENGALVTGFHLIFRDPNITPIHTRIPI